MPVPNDLSRKLHETLGNEAGDAMADWMSATDQHNAELRQEVRADIAELRQEMRAGFAAVDARFAKVDARFAETDAKMREGFARVDVRFAEMDAKFSTQFAHVDAKSSIQFAQIDAKFAAAEAAAEKRHASFMRWMLGFWLTSLVALVGAIIALARILP